MKEEYSLEVVGNLRFPIDFTYHGCLIGVCSLSIGNLLVLLIRLLDHVVEGAIDHFGNVTVIISNPLLSRRTYANPNPDLFIPYFNFRIC